MKCRTIYDGLINIDNGSSDIPGRVIQELISGNMLAQIDTTQVMTEKEEEARAELMKLNKEYKEKSNRLGKLDLMKHGQNEDLGIEERSNYETMTKEISLLSQNMRTIRIKLLAATTRPGLEDCVTLSDGTNVQLTYHGREMLHVLGARMDSSMEKEFRNFIKETEWLRSTFSERAQRAKAILKVISPKMKKHEEIFLRSAAVGLSGISETPPKEVAKSFKENATPGVLKFRSDNDLLGAEVLTIMEYQKSKENWNARKLRELRDRLSKIKSTRGTLNKEIERTATVLFSTPSKTWPDIMSHMDSIHGQRSRMGVLAIAIIALECMEGEDINQVLTRYDYYLKVIEDGAKKKEGSNSDTTAAAAFLTSSPIPPEELADRYRAVDSILDELFIDRMDAAAALISIMTPGIMETLDNIRMASAEIMRAKLSLGGMENFSLGLKLVLQAGAHVSGTLGTGKAPAEFTDISANTLTMTSAVRGHGVPYVVFHRSLVHNRAIRHHRFHPVHSHYVYG